MSIIKIYIVSSFIKDFSLSCKGSHAMQPLMGIDLQTILDSDPVTRGHLVGCFASDETLKTYTKLPAGYIVNTAQLNNVGEHWLGLYLDTDRGCDYFCSLGTKPIAKLYDQLIKRLKVANVRYSTLCIQNPLTADCGYFVYYFLYYRSRGLDFESILGTFKNYDYTHNASLISDFILHFEKYA